MLVGAGHAHLEVLRRLARRPIPAAAITLITRTAGTTYSGMLPGVVAGLYRPEDAQIDAGRLAAAAGVRLVFGEVTGIDAQARQVHCRDGACVPYDVLSVNIGSSPGAGDVPGAAEHAIPVKPIDGFLARFDSARQRIAAAAACRIGVVGAGASGVELILSLHRRLGRDMAAARGAASQLSFTLLTDSDDILPALPIPVRRRFGAILRERGIRILSGARVSEVQAGAVLLAGGERIDIDQVFWTTQAAPAPWLAGSGLQLDEQGFIMVEPTLQSASHPDVLAAGDIASMRGHPRPRSGVYAVRAGPALARNLLRLLAGREAIAYRPQRAALALISTGERRAIGVRNGLMLEGAWVWHLKDAIDRRFVARYRRQA